MAGISRQPEQRTPPFSFLTHISEVEPLCFATQTGRTGQARAHGPRPSLVWPPRPPLSKHVCDTCSRFYPPCPPGSPWQVGRQSPVPSAWLLVQEGRPPPASRPLASLADPPVSPPPRGLFLGRGRRDPTHAQSFLRCGEQAAPLPTRPAPQARKVSGARSRSARLRGQAGSPSPDALTPAPGPRPPQPAEEVGCSRFRGELAGWGPDGAGFPSLAATPLPPGSLCSEHWGTQAVCVWECSLPASNLNPCSLQWPGEGSSASPQKPGALSVAVAEAQEPGQPPSAPLHLTFPLGASAGGSPRPKVGGRF